MSLLLESTLEALAFDYVSFGLFTVVNNLWTWVAVVTAAASFWSLRFRAGTGATGSLEFHSPSTDYDLSSNGSSPVSEIAPSTAAEEPAAPPCSVSAASDKVEEGGVLTKGLKFTLYYADEGEVYGDCDDVAVEEETEEVVGCGGGEWWEGVLRWKTGEMGWCRYQDLTELNGNVVRLWDGCTTRQTYGSSKSKCCDVVW